MQVASPGAGTFLVFGSVSSNPFARKIAPDDYCILVEMSVLQPLLTSQKPMLIGRRHHGPMPGGSWRAGRFRGTRNAQPGVFGSPLPVTPWQQSVICPWFSLCAVSRSFHQQLHSSPKIRIPAHPHRTPAFSASCPILTDYHSGIWRDPQYLQLYFVASLGSRFPRLSFSLCLGC